MANNQAVPVKFGIRSISRSLMPSKPVRAPGFHSFNGTEGFIMVISFRDRLQMD